MPTLHYRVVDVFTDRPFAGDPLAVVLDADDLDASDLARIARQLNLSATAFPMQATDSELSAGAGYRLRIFTPQAELSYGDQPSIGAAWVLASLDRIRPGVVQQACSGGLVPLLIGADGGPVEVTGGVPEIGASCDPLALLAAASLPSGTALAGPAPLTIGGADYLMLADDRDVERAAADTVGVRAVGVFAWDAASRTAHCRLLGAASPAGEPSASPAAARALGVYLTSCGLLDDDAESHYTVRQGAEVGRPSRLECTVVTRAGAVLESRVAGAVAAVASGEIRRPPVRR